VPNGVAQVGLGGCSGQVQKNIRSGRQSGMQMTVVRDGYQASVVDSYLDRSASTQKQALREISALQASHKNF